MCPNLKISALGGRHRRWVVKSFLVQPRLVTPGCLLCWFALFLGFRGLLKGRFCSPMWRRGLSNALSFTTSPCHFRGAFCVGLPIVFVFRGLLKGRFYSPTSHHGLLKALFYNLALSPSWCLLCWLSNGFCVSWFAKGTFYTPTWRRGLLTPVFYNLTLPPSCLLCWFPIVLVLRGLLTGCFCNPAWRRGLLKALFYNLALSTSGCLLCWIQLVLCFMAR